MSITSRFCLFSFLNTCSYNLRYTFCVVFHMKIRFFLISFLLLTAATYALPPASDERYNSFFTWTENKKLTWPDFQGVPIDNAAEVAMATSSVEYSYYTKNKQVFWTVLAKYYPKLSWSKKSKQSNYILQHEQLHFDITELYARLFRKRLAENIKSTGDLSKISGISNTIMKEWQEEQDDYDNETNHSMNEKKQAEWNLNLKQRLDALKEFASK
jgi:hypothetical protein